VVILYRSAGAKAASKAGCGCSYPLAPACVNQNGSRQRAGGGSRRSRRSRCSINQDRRGQRATRGRRGLGSCGLSGRRLGCGCGAAPAERGGEADALGRIGVDGASQGSQGDRPAPHAGGRLDGRGRGPGGGGLGGCDGGVDQHGCGQSGRGSWRAGLGRSGCASNRAAARCGVDENVGRQGRAGAQCVNRGEGGSRGCRGDDALVPVCWLGRGRQGDGDRCDGRALGPRARWGADDIASGRGPGGPGRGLGAGRCLRLVIFGRL